MEELSIVQKTYDLIKWYVPILNRLPRDQKFLLADRVIVGLYDLLEGLLRARYAKQKLILLEPLSSNLDILRYQTRLLVDFQLLSADRYEYVSQIINEVGMELGGWIRQQKQSEERRVQPQI
jgi:hypothetical protein